MTEEEKTIKAIKWAIVLASVFTILGMAGCPAYNVWQQGMAGKSELARAEANRKVKIAEAAATLESAKYLAEAEIERAKGAAQANQIIGGSLKGNEAYLRYLWIQGMQSTQQTTVYVPTEAGLPILEAVRLNK